MNDSKVTVHDRRALLLAALADVNITTAVRYLNGDPVMRKPLAALEKAHAEAREKHPEIIGGAS
jgi:hypothetical protein